MAISTIGQNGLNAPLSLTSPALGTPSSLVLTNATGLPQAGLASGVAGNGPAFIAYGNADQTIASDTATKVQYNVETYDTANCYDTSNYRFTPNVAGYYWVHAFFEWQGTNPISTYLWSAWIYKNGSSWKRAQFGAVAGGNWKCEVQSLMYMNGSTDYIEIYAYQNYGSGRIIYNANGQIYNGFEAYLARSA